MSVDADRIALAARDCLAEAAREAGALALGFFRRGAATSARIDAKAGGSPVTEADLAADALLKARLGEAFPEAGWLSEETADDPDRLARRTLLIVDPIDGTRAFVGGDPRWAVSVALVATAARWPGSSMRRRSRRLTSPPAAGALRLTASPLSASAPADPRRLIGAGPKPVLLAMGARLGATVEVSPRVPSLAYRLCMAASGAIQFRGRGRRFARLGHRRRRPCARRGRRPSPGRSRRTADSTTVRRSGAAPCSARPTRWRRDCLRPFAPRSARTREIDGRASFGDLRFRRREGKARAPELCRRKPTMTLQTRPTKPQRLHLVFGGELKSLEIARVQGRLQDRHRRALPRLRQRRKRLARQGAADRRQRPDALFHRPSASADRTGSRAADEDRLSVSWQDA